MRKAAKKASTAGNRLRVGSWVLLLLPALILVFGGVIENTLAWLTFQTEEVENTFTYGDINLELAETDTNLDGDGNPNTNEYEMVPGNEIDKDPTVTVLAGSEACYLFVKLEESGGDVTLAGTTYAFGDFLEYEMADGWQPLLDAEDEPIAGIYYREVEEGMEESSLDYPVIKENKVLVKETVTKEMLNALDDPEALETHYPMLTITAYAVQWDNIESALAAWELIGQ